VGYSSPQPRVVLYLTVDIRDEVIDTSLTDRDGNVIVVDGAGEYLADITIYLLSNLRAEGLVPEVGIGVDGECFLLGVELEAHKLARAYLHIGRCVVAEIGLQALFDHLPLRLGQKGRLRKT